ncbi:MAG: DUF2993 domain-containing protein [Synechococcales bacterium]|nr:DUF2993 domain-containing protein [Synechococcales bacterium]
MPSPQLTRRLLSSALTLWLRSQVERVEHLQVEIVGSDRQIWSGHIPDVSLQASEVVYSGLTLSDVRLVAKRIRVNLGQIVRGQPLRLLEVVPVQVEVVLSAVDLGRSLQSELGRQALADLFRQIFRQIGAALPGLPLIPQEALASLQFHQPQVMLGGDRLTISGMVQLNHLAAAGDMEMSVCLDTELTVLDGNRLCLTDCVVTTDRAATGEPVAHKAAIDKLVINLGTDIAIQSLTISANGMICCGQINVYTPAEP